MIQEKVIALRFPIEISQLASGVFYLIVAISSFFISFSVGHPQLLVGSIVNAILFLAVAFLPNRYLLPIAILPSLGVLSRGIIFGPATPFLLYFLPFVWLGNIALMLAFKFFSTKIGSFESALMASLIKFLFLFIFANIYFKLSIVPGIFMQAMGLFQLYTALIGGAAAFIILFIYGRIKQGSQRAS